MGIVLLILELLVAVIVLGVLFSLAFSAGDIRRYIRMRSM